MGPSPVPDGDVPVWWGSESIRGTLRGTGVGCHTLQHGARVVSFHTCRVSFGPGTPLLYPWRRQQFASTCSAVQESPPRSLPRCTSGAGEEQPLGNEGVYCCPQRILKSCPQINESSSPDGCDSGFYPDSFCEVAGWSSALGAPGDTFGAVTQVQGPSKLALGWFAC